VKTIEKMIDIWGFVGYNIEIMANETSINQLGK
jgi:hypothetical protein